MAIEWAMLCDLAYFDAYRNLCLIGAQTQSPVPVLTAGVHRFTIAARLAGLRARPDVAVSVSTPNGGRSATTWCKRVDVEAVGDYLLVRPGGVPLTDEGIYRFDVSVNAREFPSIDIPVQVVAQRTYPHAPPGDQDVAPWDARGTDDAGFV